MELHDSTQQLTLVVKVIYLRCLTYDGSGFLSSVTDSLNRVVQVSSNPSGQDVITYKGFGGSERTIIVNHALLSATLYPGDHTQTYVQLFPQLAGSPATTYDEYVVSSILLPNGQHYQFQYNRFGELARVVLPSRAAVEYVWVEGATNLPNASGVISSNGSSEIYRRMGERRVFVDGTDLALRSVYTASYSGTTTDDFQTEVVEDATDINRKRLAHSAHYYFGNPSVIPAYVPNAFNFQGLAGNWGYSSWREGLEVHTDLMDNDGTSILRSVQNAWSPRANVAWWPGIASAMPSRDPLLGTITTYLDNGQTAQQAFRYDAFSNRTDVREYDYGPGTPGRLLRHTIRNFLTNNGSDYTANSIHILDRPDNELVYQLDSTDTEQLVGETIFAEDEAPPLDRPGITGLDPSYTSAYRTRGNVTFVQHLAIPSGTSAVFTYKYDVAGNPLSVTNGRGFTTSYGFSDSYGSPSASATDNTVPAEIAGQASYAFSTSATDPLGHIALQQYDFYIGRPVDSQDINGTVTSYSYNDPLERLTQIARAANQSIRTQTSLTYDDTNRIVRTTSDQIQFGDNRLHSETSADGFGRVVEVREYEDNGGVITTKQQYDGLERIQYRFNPARPSDQIAFTTTTYDGLGREISVQAQDGATAATSYIGNETKIADPAGNIKEIFTDAAGRVVQVQEDPNGLNYVAKYSYDALNNLTKVSQGSQTRSFVYNSLSRLIQSTDPESGATAFMYDADGNLTTRTDSRGVVTTLSYDANRELRGAVNPRPSAS